MNITLKDIRDLDPCYDPAKHLPEDWHGSLLDILNLKGPSPEDKIWVVTGLLDDKTKRLFIAWCAREALKLLENPDPRSVAACDVAEKFALGKATEEELKGARAAARDAADAAWGAAWAAAWGAVWAAARDAAWVLVWEADAAWVVRNAQLERLKEMVGDLGDE